MNTHLFGIKFCVKLIILILKIYKLWHCIIAYQIPIFLKNTEFTFLYNETFNF